MALINLPDAVLLIVMKVLDAFTLAKLGRSAPRFGPLLDDDMHKLLLRARAGKTPLEEHKRFSVGALRRMLRAFGAPRGGLKKELLQRLSFVTFRLCSDPACYACARLKTPPPWMIDWCNAAEILAHMHKRHGHRFDARNPQHASYVH